MSHQGIFSNVPAQYRHHRARRSWQDHTRRPAFPPIGDVPRQSARRGTRDGFGRYRKGTREDRKSVVKGKSVSGRVDAGGRRSNKEKSTRSKSNEQKTRKAHNKQIIKK